MADITRQAGVSAKVLPSLHVGNQLRELQHALDNWLEHGRISHADVGSKLYRWLCCQQPIICHEQQSVHHERFLAGLAQARADQVRDAASDAD